jgi:hypothetical protein
MGGLDSSGGGLDELSHIIWGGIAWSFSVTRNQDG